MKFINIYLIRINHKVKVLRQLLCKKFTNVKKRSSIYIKYVA